MSVACGGFAGVGLRVIWLDRSVTVVEQKRMYRVADSIVDVEMSGDGLTKFTLAGEEDALLSLGSREV